MRGTEFCAKKNMLVIAAVIGAFLLGTLVLPAFSAFAADNAGEGSAEAQAGEYLWLSYDPNGGEGPPPDREFEIMNGEYPYEAISEILPSRAGYVFLGWADSREEAEAGLTAFTFNGSESTFSPAAIYMEGSKTLWAVWAPETPALADLETSSRIADMPPPLMDFATWAVLNLVLTIVAGVFAALLLVAWFADRGKDGRGSLRPFFAAIIPTVVSAVLFVATQDIGNQLALTDHFTIWHTILAAAAVVAYLGRNKKEEEPGVI